MQHFRRGCLVDGLDCFELGAAKSDPEKNDRKIAISNSCEKLLTVPNCFGSKQPAKSSNYCSYYHLFFLAKSLPGPAPLRREEPENKQGMRAVVIYGYTVHIVST